MCACSLGRKKIFNRHSGDYEAASKLLSYVWAGMMVTASDMFARLTAGSV